MLVIFTKRRTRAVSSLYLSPSNGTQVTSAQPAAAGPWHWFHICLSDDGATWTLWTVDTGHCLLFVRTTWSRVFRDTATEDEGQSVGRGGHPTSPISGVINLQFSTAWWPTLNKTSPAAPGFLCILVAEDLLSFVLASRGKCHNLVHQASETGYPRLNYRPLWLYMLRMVRKWSSL